MNSGKLNKKIEIWGEGLTGTKNKIGEKEYGDVILKSPWASISPRTGSLLSGRSADTILSKTTHMIKIRYAAFPTLSTKNWIIYQGHRFDIDYVLDPEFKHEYLEVYVTETV